MAWPPGEHASGAAMGRAVGRPVGCSCTPADNPVNLVIIEVR